jgi:vacuolar-type H+-ATPase subunit E/Vma4
MALVDLLEGIRTDAQARADELLAAAEEAAQAAEDASAQARLARSAQARMLADAQAQRQYLSLVSQASLAARNELTCQRREILSTVLDAVVQWLCTGMRDEAYDALFAQLLRAELADSSQGSDALAGSSCRATTLIVGSRDRKRPGFLSTIEQVVAESRRQGFPLQLAESPVPQNEAPESEAPGLGGLTNPGEPGGSLPGSCPAGSLAQNIAGLDYGICLQDDDSICFLTPADLVREYQQDLERLLSEVLFARQRSGEDCQEEQPGDAG